MGGPGHQVNSADIESVYARAYAAFDRGDFCEARRLALECCNRSSKESYWHWGALGLRCWIYNFIDEEIDLREVAKKLLKSCPDAHRSWFAGLAHLNLGLWKRRHGDADGARDSLAAATAAYEAYEIDSKQPAAWALIPRYFAAVSRWVSGTGADDLERLNAEIAVYSEPESAPAGLAVAVNLLCRHARGEAVQTDLDRALAAGVSRAFLAPLLLLGGIKE